MINLHDDSGRRWITAALVGAALLSAAYWAEVAWMQYRQGMPKTGLRADGAAEPVSMTTSVPSAEALAKLLGAQPKTQAAPLGPAERFKVMGVIASASGQGAALVAVDGQPARAYRVGAELAPGFVLRSVSQKELTIAASAGGEVLATLPLPLPEPGSATSNVAGSGSTSVGASNPPSAAGGPPVVSGSRGNPRGPETPVPQTPQLPPGTKANPSPSPPVAAP